MDSYDVSKFPKVDTNKWIKEHPFAKVIHSVDPAVPGSEVTALFCPITKETMVVEMRTRRKISFELLPWITRTIKGIMLRIRW